MENEFGYVYLKVKECSSNTHEFNGKKLYYVKLYDADGYYFSKAIPDKVAVDDVLKFKLHSYKGNISILYVSQFHKEN